MRSAQLDQLTATLALLIVPGVGRARANRLIAQFGSAAAVFDLPIAEIEKVASIGRGVASQIHAFDSFDKAEAHTEKIKKLGWKVIFSGDAAYPPGWRQLNDAPPVIFSLGHPVPFDKPSIAIVGTRHCTDFGRSFTHKLAGDLVDAGLNVISGMAQGIDSAAHRGALEKNGFTAAIWGTPLNVVFPAANRGLAKQLEESGTIFSEYLPDEEVRDINFPERNRLISGMSEAVIVIEAGEKSGALVTAELALEQGKELFAVPGSLAQKQSIGTNRIIKQGAHLLTSVDDLFAQLPRLKGTVVARKSQISHDLTGAEKQIVELLSDGAQQIDYLARTMQLPINELSQYLLALELKGVVQEVAGKQYLLAQ